jgi:hypothetical protein
MSLSLMSPVLSVIINVIISKVVISEVIISIVVVSIDQKNFIILAQIETGLDKMERMNKNKNGKAFTSS